MKAEAHTGRTVQPASLPLKAKLHRSLTGVPPLPFKWFNSESQTPPHTATIPSEAISPPATAVGLEIARKRTYLNEARSPLGENKNITPPKITDTDIVVLLLGPSGSGKTSFISTAAGIDGGVGHGLKSLTSEIDVIKVRVPHGAQSIDVVLVDTPGFDNAHRSDYQTLKLISDWLKRTRENVLLHGILYFHGISDNRVENTSLRDLAMFEKLCGPQWLERVVMVTTMWDELQDEEVGRRREEELESTFWKGILSQGSTTARYKNSKESAWHILERFVGAPRQCLPGLQLRKTAKYHRSLPQRMGDDLPLLDPQQTLLVNMPLQPTRRELDLPLISNEPRDIELDADASSRFSHCLNDSPHSQQSPYPPPKGDLSTQAPWLLSYITDAPSVLPPLPLTVKDQTFRVLPESSSLDKISSPAEDSLNDEGSARTSRGEKPLNGAAEMVPSNSLLLPQRTLPPIPPSHILPSPASSPTPTSDSVQVLVSPTDTPPSKESGYPRSAVQIHGSTSLDVTFDTRIAPHTPVVVIPSRFSSQDSNQGVLSDLRSATPAQSSSPGDKTLDMEPSPDAFAVSHCLRASGSTVDAYDRSRVLLSKIITNTSQNATSDFVARMNPDDAQVMADFLSTFLNQEARILSTDEGNRILVMLCKLATSARVYPSHFVLKDVTYEDRYATKGGFASVHKGLYRKMNVCIKLIENQTDISACIKELILWAHLLHPNILPFHGVYQVSGDSNICLISPWMDNGTLCEYSNKLTPASRLPLISDVIDGLLYLHELNIVHSDLKGANVLVSDQGRALITDFGISHIATATAGQKCTSSLIGATARWAPPEAFDREGPIRPTKPQDVWSFGCLCYEVLSRKPPFHQYQRDYQLIAALIRKETPLRPEPGHEDWDEINDLVWALMETRWRCSPEDRLDIQSIHGHFAKLDFQDDRPELSRSSRKGLTQDGSINFDQVARILSEAPLSGCGNTSSAASEK